MANHKNDKPDNGASQPRLAVLIDADNAQPSVIGELLEEVAKFGIAGVKRIYGDFTSPQLGKWKDVLLEHSIQPQQQFAYTRGKNATDSSLIIDAMDLLYGGRLEGFCLVSSDSDFTRLAQRLRESGMTVYGFGEQKTPDPFVQACDRFIYTEVLRPAAAETPPVPATATPDAPAKKAEPPSTTNPAALLLKLLQQAVSENDDDQGWAHLGAVGSYLNKIDPGFDPRLHGCKKLSELFKKHPKSFSVEERGEGSSKAIYVRLLP